jgi:hypothetical protein
VRARRRWRGLLLLSIVAAALALAGFKGWRLYQRAQALRVDLRSIQALAPSKPDRRTLAALGPLLSQTRADTAALHDEAAPLLPLTRYLGWVPTYGADLVAAQPLLDAGVELTVAADEALQGLAPLLAGAAGGAPVAQTLSVRLAQTSAPLTRAAAALDRGAQDLKQVPNDTLSPPLRAGLTRVATLLPIAQDGLGLARVLPSLLGADGRREYLVLAQSTDELRATGGFISGAGVLTLDGGRLVDLTLGDSSAVDNLAASPYPDPPAPLLRYMNSELWVFRDSNWSPDFPTAARAALDLYRIGQGTSPANVIAFDPELVQGLLTAIGPLSVEGIPYSVTAENVVQEMRNPYGLPWGEGREEFKRRLARALVIKIESGGAQLDLLELARALRRGLDERHLLIYVEDPAAAAIFAAHGWDGAVRPGAADFLMVVDTNMGYNKVNPNIQEAISYSVDLHDPGAPLGQLAIKHTHRIKQAAECRQWGDDKSGLASNERYAEWMSRCYYDYLRALIPDGSRLLHAQTEPTPDAWMSSEVGDDGAVTVAEGEGGTSVLSTFLVVPLGGERTTVFHYRLPPSVLIHDARGWQYALNIQKQPGTPALPVTFKLRMPPNATLVAASPEPTASQDGTLTFTLALDTDKTIAVTFETK